MKNVAKLALREALKQHKEVKRELKRLAARNARMAKSINALRRLVKE